MRKYSFTVHFKTEIETVYASNALEALMKAMVNRIHLADTFATHIIDEKGNKSIVDNECLLKVIK